MHISTKVLSGLLLFSFVAEPVLGDDDATDWSDRIGLFANLRLRYVSIDEQGEQGRDRAQFRTRFGLNADISSDVRLVLQLASGGDNPVSANQSFDDGFSTKDIRLDLAYVDWLAADGLRIVAGKMKNPLFRAGKAGLVWDGDLNPEGIAATYEQGLFFATVGGFSVEERDSESDSLLTTIQAGVKVGVGESATLTAGASYFSYSNTVGNEPFYDGGSKGNSVDLDGNYLYDYKNAELFAQLDTTIGDWPLSIFANWVRNTEVDDQDTGYALGARLGSAKAKGDMEFGWTYMDIEADAVIGTFSDSDFGGGGTDTSGHILKLKYALSDKTSLAAGYYINELDHFQGAEHDFDRWQLGVEFTIE